MNEKIQLISAGNDKIFNMMKICDFDEEDRSQNELPHLHEFYSVFWIKAGRSAACNRLCGISPAGRFGPFCATRTETPADTK